MKKSTPESYLIEIKAKYEIEKTEEYSSYLSKPTPASLRDLCNILDNSKISPIDKEILNKFYTIDKFDIDKFRPICNFFKGKTEVPQQSIVDVMALLVNFQSRPLGKYLKKEDIINELAIGNIEETLNKKEDFKNQIQKSNGLLENQKKQSWIQKNKLKVGVFFIILFSGFVTKQVFFSTKECMIWKDNHYEAIACDETPTSGYGLISSSNIKREDYLIDNFQKIEITKNTIFFKNGRPCVWYGKSLEGNLEYFSYDGRHPETGKTLKEITPYMIEEHIMKN
ncbi:hypothetical protein [Flavobacterium sp.]|uniref:hypothetical protein n=1 Tax=Flavobacterium sp. TaxID=239 RepID=UPI00286EA95C|nr:hypothetical protein [Flavobacterium sp.]